MTETDVHAVEAPGPRATPDTVEHYIAFWNTAATDEQQRLAALAFAENISYHAPLGVMHGADALIGFRDQFAQHSPVTCSSLAHSRRHTMAGSGCSGTVRLRHVVRHRHRHARTRRARPDRGDHQLPRPRPEGFEHADH